MNGWIKEFAEQRIKYGGEKKQDFYIRVERRGTYEKLLIKSLNVNNHSTNDLN